VLIYIGSSAVAAGIPRNVAFYFVAIINAGTGAGRIVWGLLGDRFGGCYGRLALSEAWI
jgi:hypothetical protein